MDFYRTPFVFLSLTVTGTLFIYWVDNKVLFRCEIFLDFATVALSFVCGKYCPIMD